MSNPGISSYLANAWLNMIRGTAFTAPAAVYLQMHKDVPGAAGTTNVSAQTARSQGSFAAAAGGAIALTGTLPSWTITATEAIEFVTVWDNATAGAGDFLWSAALATTKNVEAGDTLTLTTCGLSIGALAA